MNSNEEEVVESTPAVSIGAVVGGVARAPSIWGEELMALSRRVEEIRGSSVSPLRVNIVFHVPGEVLLPEHEGVRTGRYSKKDRHLMVQAAVPETPYSKMIVDNLLWLAIEEAESFGHKRKLFIGELTEVRRIIATATA